MDLSALIFVALAVAWAVYLVPKALKHHEDVVRSRSVDRFSSTMRVLARREPVTSSSARLVVTPGRAPSTPVVTTKASAAATSPASSQADPAATAGTTDGTALPRLTPEQRRRRREAAARAARRRRRVLLALLGGLVAVLVPVLVGYVAWPYLAVPVTLLVAWLVACRLMVRRERGISGPLSRIPAVPVDAEEAARPADPEVAAPAAEADDETAETPAVRLDETGAPLPPIQQPGLWDPVPVTLPTYVDKPVAARRTVRTIDLDATGVWTSGRTDADAAIAREAEQAQQAERDAQRSRRDSGDGPGRAVGS